VAFSTTNFLTQSPQWTDIKNLFWEMMEDTETAQQFFTETQLTNWGNKALQEMSRATRPIDKITSFNTVAESPQYDLGSGVIKVTRVVVDRHRLDAVTEGQLFAGQREWRRVVGVPRLYWVGPFTDSDSYVFGLHPEPGSVYSSKAYFTKMPDAVSTANDTNRPQVPTWAVYGILWSMLSDAYRAEGRRFNAKASKFFRMLFEDTVSRLRARSFSRLNKDWAYGHDHPRERASLRSALPNTIQAGPDVPTNFGLGIIARAASGEVAAAALMDLAWDSNAESVSNFDKYNIYRGTQSDNLHLFESTDTGFNPELDGWNDSTRVAGNTYYYKVTAVNTYGYESGLTDLVTVTVST